MANGRLGGELRPSCRPHSSQERSLAHPSCLIRSPCSGKSTNQTAGRPHGLPGDCSRSRRRGDRGQRQVTRSELGILTLLFLLGGGIFWFFQRANETATVVDSTSPPSAAAFATDASIAVLPFVNMSADKVRSTLPTGSQRSCSTSSRRCPSCASSRARRRSRSRARTWRSPRLRGGSMLRTYSKEACGSPATSYALRHSSFEHLTAHICGRRHTTGI